MVSLQSAQCVGYTGRGSVFDEAHREQHTGHDDGHGQKNTKDNVAVLDGLPLVHALGQTVEHLQADVHGTHS